MKTLIFVSINLLVISALAQSTFEYRNVFDTRTTPSKRYRNCIITSLGYHQFDGNYEKATELQLGVIGNDYNAQINIGSAPAENDNINIWIPIDGFKRTFIGRHNLIFSMDLNDGDAADDDWNVRIITDINNPLIANNKERLEGLDEIKYPINYINGEIDIKQVNKIHMMEYADFTPKAWIDYAGIHGPWVYDRGWRHSWLGSTVGDVLDNDLFGAHGCFIEIHPMEQLWWTEKKFNKRIYHLNMANDNSGHFNETSDYDEGDGVLEQAWQTNPMIHTYYIPFNIPIRSELVYFTLSVISMNNLTRNYTDGVEHNLVYNNRKLLNIKEPPGDIVQIEFVNTGIDPVAIVGNVKDTLIKGFIKIESSIGRTGGDYAGNLFLTVTEENPNLSQKKDTDSKEKKFGKVKVTLQSITCTGADDGDSQEDLMGFIGVRAASEAFYPLEANQLPNKNETPLLWSKLDSEAQKIKEAETIRLRKSFTYSLPVKRSVITLIADLDEDDENEDNNKTTLDGDEFGFDEPDDKLESDFSENTVDDGMMEAGVVYKTIKVKDLSLNQPINRKMVFGSGGTRIEVLFKIELIKLT